MEGVRLQENQMAGNDANGLYQDYDEEEQVCQLPIEEQLVYYKRK